MLCLNTFVFVNLNQLSIVRYLKNTINGIKSNNIKSMHCKEQYLGYTLYKCIEMHTFFSCFYILIYEMKTHYN